MTDHHPQLWPLYVFLCTASETDPLPQPMRVGHDPDEYTTCPACSGPLTAVAVVPVEPGESVD